MQECYKLRLFPYVIGVLFLTFGQKVVAQNHINYQYINAKNLSVLGKANAETAYHRVSAIERMTLPKQVAELATNSAGINVLFQTNARSISVKWVLDKYKTLWNMTPVAVNGMDLYGWNGSKWQYVASARPQADSNQAVLVKNLDRVMRHYRLYLPLYAGVNDLEIGIEAGATILKADPKFLPQKKVVIYGSSITQGASASRPGMAYPSILSRELNVEVFNMGFSGSGKMELPVAEVLARMEADVYVLDCVPNPSPGEIRERAVPFIKRLRQLKPTIPIVLVESIIREDAWWDQQKQSYVRAQNRAFHEAYEQLQGERFTQLYYIPADKLIGDDHEATIDGTHLTDVGFIRLAGQLRPVIQKLLQ